MEKLSEQRHQVLNYGGGRQTVAMCILVAEGALPRPDRVLIADTGREADSTWWYLYAHVRPMLRAIGMDVEIAQHTLATVDLHGKNGDLLLPVYTATGKFPTYCSNEWKAYVIQRYLRSVGIDDCENWIGFTVDESSRIKKDKAKCWTKRYPLIELMLTRSDCEKIILKYGLPLPPKSACWMCPHRNNEEWRFLRDNYPEQFAAACKLDDEIREDDDEHAVYLHEQRVPLREADLSVQDRGEPNRQCGLGFCMT